MPGLTSFWRRLRAMARQSELDEGLSEEIQFHLEQETAKNIERGMSPEHARRQARLRFGGVEPMRERARDEFRWSVLTDFGRDARIGLRTLRRSPGFALAAILTLGLGTGAATAVFSVVYGVLLSPLPYPESDRLVRLYQLGEKGGRGNVSEMNADDWQARTHGFGGIARMQMWGPTAAIGGTEPVMAVTTVVSREFFDVMKVTPAEGRLFAGEELTIGGRPAAIVSHAFWTRSLGRAPMSGQTLRISDRVYAVVGIMPEGFDYPGATAIWLARELNPPDTSRTAHNFQVVARLRDGVEYETARAELSQVSRELKKQHGDDTWMFDATAVPLLEQLTSTSKPTLQLLFGAALLLLIIANTNISSLLLARAAARRHEFAVQLAIGAGRARIARQLLAETAVITVVGGAVGVLTAVWVVRALVALGPGTVPRLDQAHVNWIAMTFALAISGLAAGVLSLITATTIRGVRLASALSESQRSGTASRRSLVVRQLLVVGQVALTLVLLAGTGLLGRSFTTLLAVDPGFNLADALIVDFTAVAGGSNYQQKRVELLDGVLERIRRIPGVDRVGLATGFPLGGGNYSNGQFLEMTTPDELASRADLEKLGVQGMKPRAGHAGYRIVGGDYFNAMGIRLLKGRGFEEGDSLDAPHVAVISESLAHARWPDRDPLGRFVQFGNMDGDLRGFRIVGVVGDVREITPEAPPEPLFYVSYRQRPNALWRVSAIVRGPDPAAITQTVQRTLHDLDPQVPIQFRTVDQAFNKALSGRRFSLVLISTFGTVALILATFGLYSVIAYLVAQRTREMGIRMALGATSTDVLRLIVGRGALLGLCGVTVGVAVALSLGRVVQDMLFGIAPTDPGVLVSVVGMTLFAAIAASYLPARRATRVSPISGLREQ